MTLLMSTVATLYVGMTMVDRWLVILLSYDLNVHDVIINM